MYDITTAVIRGQGGPHIGHEALLREALTNTKENGTFVQFLGSAQARPEPSNPFSWREREIPFRKCLERLMTEIGKQVNILILPLRDRTTNLLWANSLYSALVKVAQETGADVSKMAIIDANKNGDQSAYERWFEGKLHVLPVGIIPGVHATGIREKFFLEEVEPALIEGLTPEAVEFLSNWKDSFTNFQWLQAEYRFRKGFAKALSKHARAVVCSGSRILLFRRVSVNGPGYNQYDIPLVGSSVVIKGEQEGFEVYYPGIDNLLMDDSIRDLRLVNEVKGTGPVRMYDLDVNRENDFFGVQNGWHLLPVMSSFHERANLLKTPLVKTVSPGLLNDYQQLCIPEWIEFDSLPTTEFFRRETVLYLEPVLGEIPVQVGGCPI